MSNLVYQTKKQKNIKYTKSRNVPNIIYSNLVIVGVFLICFFQGIVSMILPGIPIVYLCDLLLIISIPILFTEKSYRRQNIFSLWFFVVAFFIVGIWGDIINDGKLIYFLWGFRNYFRFFIFFFFCVYFLRERDADWCMKVIEWSFYPHMILIFIQYFILGYEQDFLSGIWGVGVGGNGGLNIYLIGLMSMLLYQLYKREISLAKYLFFLVCICFNAALSELKFLFVEIAIITIIYFLVCKFSIKNLKMLIYIGTILVAGVALLGIVFPHYLNYFSYENLYSAIFHSHHYASGQDVGRSAVFSTLTPILKNWSGKQSLVFGIGLGNGDYSSAFSILNTNFFNEYESIHYTWLSLGYLFVETGYIGTFLYLMFFVSIAIISVYRFKVRRADEYLFTFLFSIACLMIVLYNSSLRSNYAYLAFFWLSFSFVKNSCFIEYRKIWK